ncbi:PLP-dependent cysteine synthase family protein [Rhizobium sp. BT-175]|uniref:PLP-dependent cysteine synthase family protein n=1 Tax=Rhizobium sp. BT-175 TaxID=2986929 RepID=UPI0022360E63|nr:cysteine synthase family protein [Rhizobium sp. BT-175]MCV9947666.1 cysteine synthase family protein [Rhizobium sp. BT-175]
MILSRITDLVGHTHMMEIPVSNPNARLFLKLEKFNPGGSMKDRMAISMVDAAERDGLLRPGGTIVESSSGNTGIGLAIVAAERGYQFIAVVDHHASKDKLLTMRALGAQLHFVTGVYAENEVAVVERQETAARLGREIPGAVFMNQSDNPANPAGYADLADAICSEVGSNLRLYVSCAGTGGSITGVGRRLKKIDPKIHVIAVEPEGSIIFGNPPHPYYQSGTGTPGGDEVGKVMDYSVVDEGITVGDREAFATCRFIARRFGLLIGGSTGGALFRALERVNAPEFHGVAVCNVCDGGEKYLQSIFDDEWLSSRQLLTDQFTEFLTEAVTRRSWNASIEISAPSPLTLVRSVDRHEANISPH